MLVNTSRRRSLQAAAVAPLVFLSLLSITAGGQSPQPAAPAAAPAVPLQPYTASDQSASAGVPSGWKVTSGAKTVIQMSSPQGVSVSLGNTVIARDAAFDVDQKPANGINLSMPYTATLEQKLTMILQQSAASSGKPTPQVTIDSTTPLQLPATIGQCARFVADLTGKLGAMKLLAVFCSLPLDPGGVYKNIMLAAQAPTATAAQAAPIAQAVFQSYRIPTAWLQKKLAPFTVPPAASAAATAAEAKAINQSTLAGMAAANNSANCFDLSVLRQTPTYLLPRSCGGTKPN
jgi:hypothetical protein